MANLDSYGNPTDGSDPFTSPATSGEVMGSGIGPGTAPSPDFGASLGTSFSNLLGSAGTGAKSIWDSLPAGSALPLGVFGASLLSKPKAPDLTNLNDIAGLLKTNKTAGLQTSSANSPNFAGMEAGAGALDTQAGILEGEGNLLLPSARTGHLPDSAGTLVSNNLRDTQNAIKAKYAQMGLSGSTMEQQDLSGAEANSLAQTFQIATSLTNTGLQELGLAAGDRTSAAGIRSSAAAGENAAILGNAQLSDAELAASAGIYENIMKTQMEQDAALQTALANFAGQFAIGQGLATRSANSGAGGVPPGGWTDGLGNVFDKNGQLVRAAENAAGNALGNALGSAAGSAVGQGIKGLFSGAPGTTNLGGGLTTDAYGNVTGGTGINTPGSLTDAEIFGPGSAGEQAGMQGIGADAIYGDAALGAEAGAGGAVMAGGTEALVGDGMMAAAEDFGFEELLSLLAFA